MSENRVKHVRHYSVRKREAREFHGSGLISNHVNFARDVEVSTIATTKAWEEYNEESKIESQTLHYMDVFSVEFVVQFFWERLRTKFFLAKSANPQKVAPYDDSFEPLTTEEEAVSNNARMDQEAEQISQLSQITNTEILPIIQQI